MKDWTTDWWITKFDVYISLYNGKHFFSSAYSNVNNIKWARGEFSDEFDDGSDELVLPFEFLR